MTGASAVITIRALARAPALTLALSLGGLPAAADPDPADWPAVLAEARGQTVWFHAWGGSAQSNDFIAWAGERVAEEFGVRLEHVRLADTADAVSRVVAEKTAGTTSGGAVDLIWINGPNFAAMKEQGLLFGPWAESLPNWALVDPEENAALTADFTVPTEGLEAPWAMAQVVFWHDTARVPDPPRSMAALLDWATANPGRFAFPQPPDFLGTTFLKQALVELAPDPAVLAARADDPAYATATAPLWDFLDRLTPHLWRGGRAYPANGEALKPLMADGEIDLAISFSPGAASAAIAAGELPATVRSYVLDGGTIGNASFLAIPFNASAKAGAMVVANFLMSPEAQLRMQDPAHLGWGTVLAMDRLAPEDAAAFAALDLGPATLSPAELGPALPEPHPSWMTRVAADWTARYGVR
jgi:putative thiamine transport system substrate-binding protein